MRLLIISHPFPWASGASKRNFEVLKHFKECGHEVTLIFSPFFMKWLIFYIKMQKKDIKWFFDYTDELENKGIVIHHGSKQFIYDIFFSDSSLNWAQKKLFLMSIIFHLAIIDHMISDYMKKYLKDLKRSYDFIYSHHESLDTVMLAHHISGKLNVPFAILLQGEPYKLGYNLIKNKKFSSIKEFTMFILTLFSNFYSYFFYRKAINSRLFTGLLAISPSPIMISGLLDINHKILSPSNAFDHLLLQYRATPLEKENNALFFQDFHPKKEFLSYPLSGKLLSKKSQS